MVKLSKKEVEEQVSELTNWTLENSKISKTFVFKNFKEAFEAITQIAAIANELNHHPEWSNVYNKLTVALTTHDVEGLSNLDFIFAKKIDLITANYK
jgi:4a-hydroxytetrahydrobiopterin dehydratase